VGHLRLLLEKIRVVLGVVDGPFGLRPREAADRRVGIPERQELELGDFASNPVQDEDTGVPRSRTAGFHPRPLENLHVGLSV